MVYVSKNMVKITVLHNELDRFVDESSGFSLLVKVNDIKILFDVSFSDQILKNAKKGNIDLSNIDFLVLSHGHIDHTDGLKFIDFSSIKNLVAHPYCFQKKYFKGEGEIGCPLSLDELKQKTKIILSKELYWVKENKIVFLGEIPRNNQFEAKKPIGYLDNKKEDFVLDDSAIIILSNKGLIIISGCSHSGICNIIEYAKEVTKENKIFAVIGGFHLFNKEQTDKTIEYLKKQDINKIYPAHCLSDYAFSEFEKIGAKRITTLQQINL